MIKGLTNKGVFSASGETVIFRIEQDPDDVNDVYLFIFSSDLEKLIRDELYDNFESAKKSAIEWGANEEWLEEQWKVSFSSPPEGFRVTSFHEEHGMTISDYLKDDSKYL